MMKLKFNCLNCKQEFFYYYQKKFCCQKCQQRYWRKSHKEHLREYMIKWKKLNPDKIKQYVIKFRKKYGSLYQRKHYYRIKNEIFTLLGSKCSKCGYSKDWRVLQIDHVYGRGDADRKIKLGSYKYYRMILSELKMGSKNYQLLCANCNILKKYENNELNQFTYKRRNY